MARSRNIKPGFFLNDKLAEIEPLGRLLFAGLWTIADREGRLEDRPKRIKVEVLPYDDCDVNYLLNELHKRKFIIRYEVDGERYIQIANWHKHQNPHCKEKKSTIPAPCLHVQDQKQEQTNEPETQVSKNEPEPEPLENQGGSEAPKKHHASTVQEPEKHITNPADSFNLIPDSFNLIPSSFNKAQDGNNDDDFWNEIGSRELTEEEKMAQQIERHYNKRQGKIGPLTQKENEAIDRLIKSQIPLADILNGIDESIQFKKGRGERVYSLSYCAEWILDKKNRPKKQDKPEKLPEALRMQQVYENQPSQPVDPEKQAAILAKLRLMDERFGAKENTP